MLNVPDTKSSNQKMPIATKVALVGLALTGALIVFDFGNQVVRLFQEGSGPLTAVLLLLSFLISIALPVLAVVGLCRGWRVSPLIVTVVAAWSIALVLQFPEISSFVSAGAGLVATLASWMPSARAYKRRSRGMA